MKSEDKFSIMRMLVSLVFLVFPTIWIIWLLSGQTNAYLGYLNVNPWWQTLFFSAGMIAAFLLYSFRARFLITAGLLAFLLYLVSSTAELNRGPLDLSEAESELTGGFHTEYGGMGFSMFFLAEFVNMFAAAGLGATFFLGGFLAPHIGLGPVDNVLDFVPGWMWFGLKAYFLIFLYMWFRWTFPRLRIDHLLALEWKILLPASLVNLLLGAGLITFNLFLP